jgi:hypothetical protein
VAGRSKVKTDGAAGARVYHADMEKKPKKTARGASSLPAWMPDNLRNAQKPAGKPGKAAARPGPPGKSG